MVWVIRHLSMVSRQWSMVHWSVVIGQSSLGKGYTVPFFLRVSFFLKGVPPGPSCLFVPLVANKKNVDLGGKTNEIDS